MKNINWFVISIVVPMMFFSCGLSQQSQKNDTVIGSEEDYYRDLYADTWVATDGVGREMPDYEETGPLKKDQRRVVGIFYITWHTQNLAKQKQPYESSRKQCQRQRARRFARLLCRFRRR